MANYISRNKGSVIFYTERGYASDNNEAQIFVNKFLENKNLSVKEIVGYQKYHLLRSNSSSLRKEYQLKHKTEAEYITDKKRIGGLGIKPTQKEYWLNLGHSEDVAIEKQKTEQRKRSKRCEEYWTSRGYSQQEAKEKISEHQVNTSLEAFINRYGQDDGTIKYNNWKHLQKIKSIRSFLYWMNLGYSEEESRNIVSRIQTNFVKANISNKSKIEINFANYLSSKISSVKTDIIIDNYLPDIMIKDLIVEIFGDFWHMNPDHYKYDDINKITKLTAASCWEKDEKRLKYFNSKGFKTMVIWESELNRNGYDYYLEIIKNKLQK